MHFDRRTRKLIRSDIWREGEYLDLWSVPHFLSGFALGLAAHLIGFSTAASFVIVLLLLIGYEMFEVIAKIEETRMNRILDVVVGMASFTLAFLLAPLFSSWAVAEALVLVAALDAVLSWFGWRASHKASVLEAKMRAEYEEQMVRLRAHRARGKRRKALRFSCREEHRQAQS